MTSNTHHANLTITFVGYWHTGSGTGAGHHVDALCLRDENGLPFLPGRLLKGVLRHAVYRACNWGWYDDLPAHADALPMDELLFGSRTQQEYRHGTEPGMLLVDNACLPPDEYCWLAQSPQAAERSQLFTELFSTAIEADGTAKQHSLRGLEACLPVTLQARLTLAATALKADRHQLQDNWLTRNDPWQPLTLSLPLVDALGAHRNRGLGEARLTLDANSAAGVTQ